MVAIAVEVGATSCLKLAGQGSVVAILAVVLGYASAFALLAWLVQRLEVGIVYAVWSGAGTALVAVIGIAIYHESLTATKVCGLAFVICGVVLLNMAGAH